MICPNCGAQIPDGAAFCTNCGNAAPAQQTYQQPQPQPQQPYQPQPTYQQPYQPPIYGASAAPAAQPNTLVIGILSLVFDCFFYTSIVGMILGIIGNSKAKKYRAQGGVLTGKAKVGAILSKIGMILGIVMVIGFVIWLAVIIIAAIAGGTTSYSSYSSYFK